MARGEGLEAKGVPQPLLHPSLFTVFDFLQAPVQRKSRQPQLLGCQALIVIGDPQAFLNNAVLDLAQRVLAYLHFDADHLTVSMRQGCGRLFDRVT